MTDRIDQGSADEQAASWYARLNAADDPADEARLEAWIARSDANRKAWASLQSTDQKLSAARFHPAFQTLLDDARSIEPEPRQRRLGGIALAASLAAVLAVGGASIWLARSPSSTTATTQAADMRYETRIGERRQIILVDGTTVLLDTDSALSVPQWGTTREVRLSRGQALFSVAHDAEHPFIVSNGERAVEALGTQFVVRADLDRYAVALLQGKVRVSVASSQQPAILAPGDRLTLEKEAVSITHGTAKAMAEWSDGHLTFDQLPLRQIIAEMNRYSARKIVLENEALGNRPLSGTFDLDGGNALVEALEASGIARVLRAGDRQLVLAAP